MTNTTNGWEKKIEQIIRTLEPVEGSPTLVLEDWKTGQSACEALVSLVNDLLAAAKKEWEEEIIDPVDGWTNKDKKDYAEYMKGFTAGKKEGQAQTERKVREEIARQIENERVFEGYSDTAEGRKSRHENRLYNSALDKILSLLTPNQEK